MSEENRVQIHELISSIWSSVLEEISESRDLSVADLNTIADTLGARTPEMAVSSGLVDEILYFDQYEKRLKQASGTDVDDQNYISLTDYAQASSGKKLQKRQDKIAVVFAQGEMFYGEGDKDRIGQGIIVRALKKAREAENVKAIVLRVDTPVEMHSLPILSGASSCWPRKQNLW